MSKPGKAKLDAVYETDLENFLEQFGLLDAYRARTLGCLHCDALITLDNLFGFIAHSPATLGPICSKPQCVEAVYGRTQERGLRGDGLNDN